MTFGTSSELLDALLKGHELTPSEMEAIVTHKMPEDFHLDYKHGNEIKDKNKGARTIRAYVTAFANSIGGVLIIGVDEAHWRVTGCSAPRGHDLARWATDCLSDIFHYFSPLPKIQVVKHTNGKVLVIATDRSLNLVPSFESRQLVYYLRFNDQTRRIPDFLVSDLLLGRRQHAYINITNLELRHAAIDTSRDHRHTGWADFSFIPYITLENESFGWANDVRVGLVGLVKKPEGATYPIGRHLQSHIDIQELSVEGGFRELQRRQHFITHSINLEPFMVTTIAPPHSLSIPAKDSMLWTYFVWNAAIYVISKDTPPSWYQLKVTINRESIESAYKKQITPASFIDLKRMVGERPLVAWTDFTTAVQ